MDIDAVTGYDCRINGHSWYKIKMILNEETPWTLHKCTVCRVTTTEKENSTYEDWGF